MSQHPDLCVRFHRAIELIGRRWSGAIISLLLKEPLRVGVLRDAIPGITDRMLCERLRELEQERIVERTVFPETPVRIEYGLTAKGRALGGVMESIGTWAHEWLPDPAVVGKPSRRASGRAGRASSRSKLALVEARVAAAGARSRARG
jgi:DNA-binding HxlR family transcriptional regulator